MEFNKIPKGEKIDASQSKNSFMEVIADVEEGSGGQEKIMKKFEDPSCCTASECCRKSTFCNNSCKTSICCAYCVSFRNLSWVTKGLIVLFLSVSVITLEFAADTGFCYYNPVVPMTIVPMSTARGEPVGATHHAYLINQRVSHPSSVIRRVSSCTP